jgi:hypothetical protein
MVIIRQQLVTEAVYFTLAVVYARFSVSTLDICHVFDLT